jgi:peptidyl-prolyl cis-trans isomerase A (cyclophilin A)
MKLTSLALLPLLAFPVAVPQVSQQAPRVVIETELGSITVEVYPEQAPVTVANFLQYVDEGRFEGATFYRVVRLDNQPNDDVKIEVIQGGPRPRSREGRLPPIEHETTEVTGVRHVDGAISMARNRPGSASSEFFICVGNQPELDYGGRRNPDGQGFAAFGKIVSGMDVVRRIQQQGPGAEQYLENPIPIVQIARISPRSMTGR